MLTRKLTNPTQLDARPMTPTVAYRLSPAAYATPADCASICSAFTPDLAVSS